jgi:DNA-binding response OmpR family regulator
MFTILVVEDNPQERSLYCETLRDAGFWTLTASNGEDALCLISQEHPDLVLLDIDLPDMTGLDVLRQARLATPRLPIILHTAYGSFQDDFMSWAADDYVIKSGDLDDLLHHVENLMPQRALDAAMTLP